MLESTTSKDLVEFRAYEMVNGPIGPQRTEEALASIHEQLQQICRLLIAQGVEDEDDIPEIHRYPRPYEIFNREVEDG